MTVPSLAAWALRWRSGAVSPSSARDRAPGPAFWSYLGWAAPAGAAFAALSAVAGAAFRDRPTVFGALVVGAVVMVPLLFRGIATRVRAFLDSAVAERESLRAELDAAQRAKEELRSLAYHDDLTGLPNRSLLYDRLGLAITQSHREASHLAVVFLDLDHFKAVNDSLGHGSGDRLLVEFADRVRSSVRAGDTVARLGGDEFIVLLDSVTGAEDAARVAAKVRDAVRAPFRFEGHEVRMEASAGVSVYPADGTSADELLRVADAAMYRDKQRAAAPGPGAVSAPAVTDDEMNGVN